MAHQKIIDSVKKQGQVTIKDLDEFLRFVINEYDMRTLNNNYISILIPMQLDVNKPYAERIKKYLRGAEVQGDGSSLSKTAKFSDGFEMDIRCCGGKDDSWTEAILYDNTGKEVVATEPCDGFTGCWELKDEDTNTVYRAHVMTKSNLN